MSRPGTLTPPVVGAVLAILGAAQATWAGPGRDALPSGATPEARDLARDCDRELGHACVSLVEDLGDAIGAETRRALLRRGCYFGAEDACATFVDRAIPAGSPVSWAANALACDDGDTRACSTLIADVGASGDVETLSDVLLRACSGVTAETCGSLSAPWTSDASVRGPLLDALSSRCGADRTAACGLSEQSRLGGSSDTSAIDFARRCDQGDASACVDLARSSAGNPVESERIAVLGCALANDLECAAVTEVGLLGPRADAHRADARRLCDGGSAAFCLLLARGQAAAASTGVGFASAFDRSADACRVAPIEACAELPGVLARAIADRGLPETRSAYACEQGDLSACRSLSDIDTGSPYRALSRHLRAHLCAAGDESACAPIRVPGPCSVQTTTGTRQTFRYSESGAVVGTSVYWRGSHARVLSAELTMDLDGQDLVVSDGLVSGRIEGGAAAAELLQVPFWLPGLEAHFAPPSVYLASFGQHLAQYFDAPWEIETTATDADLVATHRMHIFEDGLDDGEFYQTRAHVVGSPARVVDVTSDLPCCDDYLVEYPVVADCAADRAGVTALAYSYDGAGRLARAQSITNECQSDTSLVWGADGRLSTLQLRNSYDELRAALSYGPSGLVSADLAFVNFFGDIPYGRISVTRTSADGDPIEYRLVLQDGSSPASAMVDYACWD